LHSISLWNDAEATQELLTIMQIPNPQLQRVAAEALGRIGNTLRSGALQVSKRFEENSLNWVIPGLLTAAAGQHDRVLEHSITYALIEADIPVGTTPGLTSFSPYEARTALIALDQMDHGGLQAETVVPFLHAPEPELRQAASWVASHHPEWGAALAGFFRERLASKDLSEADQVELKQQLARFARAPEIQKLMGATLQVSGVEPVQRELLLQVMAQTSLNDVPAEWNNSVRSCLAAKETALLRPAIAAARTLGQAKTNAPNFEALLVAIASNDVYPDDVRLEALAASPHGLQSVEQSLLNFLIANVDSSRPALTRGMAAGVLARARLTDEQLLRLSEVTKSAGPLELTRILGAFEHSANEAVGLKLLKGLQESKALASVRPDLLKSTVAKYPQSVQDKAKELIALLNVDVEKQSAHLKDLLASLKEGDIRRGQAIFNSEKTACFVCHKLGYMGGTVGPDLTSIGQARTERDLLESIVYPSASFVRSYEPVVVSTKSGEQFNGLIRKDSADELVLATGPNAETKIARSDIVDTRPGTVSIMPAGLDEQLSKQELADLLAFLKGTKWGPR